MADLIVFYHRDITLRDIIGYLYWKNKKKKKHKNVLPQILSVINKSVARRNGKQHVKSEGKFSTTTTTTPAEPIAGRRVLYVYLRYLCIRGVVRLLIVAGSEPDSGRSIVT